MANHKIITISREYGSGGKKVGEKLAKHLGIPFYDNELIAMAAEKSGMSKHLFKDSDMASMGNILLSLSTFASPNNEVYGMPLNEKIFLIQSQVIKEIAEKESCVILGRCADFILQDFPNCTNVFLHGELESRVARAIEEYGLDRKHAESVLHKTDKRRASYYNYFTNKKWGSVTNYDLVLSTSKISIDAVVEVISTYAALKDQSLQ